MADFTQNLDLELPTENEFYAIQKFNSNFEIIDKNVSNPNLLDNPWFTVNQRGVSSWSQKYGVDRWVANLGSTSTNQTMEVVDGLKITSNVASGGIAQLLEQSMLDRDATYTFSVMLPNGRVYSNNLQFLDDWDSRTLYDEEGNALPDFVCAFRYNQNDLVSVAFVTLPSSGMITIKAVKLEYGEHSTLANDHAPDYATELLKCMRYYQVVNGRGLKVHAVTPTFLDVAISTKIRMRTQPSVVNTDNGDTQLFYATGQSNAFIKVTGFTRTITGYFTDSFQMRYTKTNHGITVAQAGTVSTGDQFVFSADL